MAKAKPIFTLESFGIYEPWGKVTKALPKIQQQTTTIPACIDIEFGLSIRVLKGKGLVLRWRIDHPDISDKKGRVMAPFEGEEYIRTNDWQFYLGDTLWAPLEDKTGDWLMSIHYEQQVVTTKCFEVTLDDLDYQKQQQFWKRRGC